MEIFHKVNECIEVAHQKASWAREISVKALGITNQRETVVVW